MISSVIWFILEAASLFDLVKLDFAPGIVTGPLINLLSLGLLDVDVKWSCYFPHWVSGSALVNPV